MSYSGSDKRLAYLFSKQYDLADLGDTDITNLTNGQILRYDGLYNDKWENAWQEDYSDTLHQVGIINIGNTVYRICERTAVQNAGTTFHLGSPNYIYWIVEGFVTESNGLILPLNYYQDSTHYVRAYVDKSGADAWVFIDVAGFTLSGHTMLKYRCAIPLS